MSEKTFRAYNAATGSLSGSAIPTSQATSASSGAPRTMLQLAPPSPGPAIRIIGWGYSFISSPPANNPYMDLIDSGTVFASGLTAHVAAGIQRMSCPAGEASMVAGNLGAALTGYATGATTENTPTASGSRSLDGHAENGLYFYWRFELGREPEVQPGNCLRLRATPSTAAALNLLCWIDWAE